MTKYDNEGFNERGFDRVGFHKVTHDEYDPNGFDVLGFDVNGFDKNGFNNNGFNKAGYDKKGFNRHGYDKQGFDLNGLNKDGFNKDGYDKDGYNKDGFDKEGYDKDGYDKDGYDKDGYDKDGFNENGIYFYTKTHFNKKGFDKNGFRKDGFNKSGYNKDGYDVYGYNEYGYDKNGFNKDGYDEDGYDLEKIDKNGYNVEGYPIKFGKTTEEGYKKIRAFVKSCDLNPFYNITPEFYKIFNNGKYNYIYNNKLLSSLWFDNIFDEDNDNILSRFVVVKNNNKYNILIVYSDDPTGISHYDNSDEYNFTYKEIVRFGDEIVKQNIPNFNIIRSSNYTNEIIDTKVGELIYDTWLDEIVEYKDWGSFFTCTGILNGKKINLDLDIYKDINNGIGESNKDISDEVKFNKILEVEDRINKVYKVMDDEHLYNLNNGYKEKTYLDEYEEQYKENN